METKGKAGNDSEAYLYLFFENYIKILVSTFQILLFGKLEVGF